MHPSKKLIILYFVIIVHILFNIIRIAQSKKFMHYTISSHPITCVGPSWELIPSEECCKMCQQQQSWEKDCSNCNGEKQDTQSKNLDNQSQTLHAHITKPHFEFINVEVEA